VLCSERAIRSASAIRSFARIGCTIIPRRGPEHLEHDWEGSFTTSATRASNQTLPATINRTEDPGAKATELQMKMRAIVTSTSLSPT
jgi:hypothetical protein